jgi:hypothetical protein
MFQYPPMSYQDLEEAFERATLTVSKLQRFRKEQLERFCEANSIKVQQKGVKRPIKAAYVAALFNAVCNGYHLRTHIDWLPEPRRCGEGQF